MCIGKFIPLTWLTIATTKPCCLCSNTVDAKTTVQLFSATGYRNKWASRITALLLVQGDETDFLPSTVCARCAYRYIIWTLWKRQLQIFRELAQRCMSTHQLYGPLKHTRVTSSDTGVSPDTARVRPTSKLTRKKLVFSCKLIKLNIYKLFNKIWCNFSLRKVIHKFDSSCWRKVHPQGQLCRTRLAPFGKEEEKREEGSINVLFPQRM